MRLAFIVLLFCLGLCWAEPPPEHIDVWIVPHSHDDVGWLLTVEEYYEQKVKSIFDTTISALQKNPARKFSQVEMCFFSLWWRDQNVTTREAVQALVANGQLEFTLGGWVMQDEAASHYAADINQMTEGHEFIMRQFGLKARPRVSWHPDPFGQTSVTASMFADMCFDAHAWMRLPYDLQEEFKRTRTTEFIWQPSESRGAAAALLTHILESHYESPQEINFEERPETRITDENIKERADIFLEVVKRRRDMMRTKNVFIPFGGDFKFQQAHLMYDNMDRLMEYINERPGEYNMTIRYATISEYFTALRKTQLEEGIVWPVRRRDFLPYEDSGSHGDSWWTGYYTSRPRLKGLSRYADNILRAAEQITALVWARYGPYKLPNGEGPIEFNRLVLDETVGLTALRRANAIIQHHDAIAGTAKQHVIADYVWMLEKAINAVRGVTETLLPHLVFETLEKRKELLPVDYIEQPPKNKALTTDPRPLLQTFADDKIQEAVKKVTGNGTLALSITLYNSLGWPVSTLHRLPVPHPRLTVWRKVRRISSASSYFAEDENLRRRTINRTEWAWERVKRVQINQRCEPFDSSEDSRPLEDSTAPRFPLEEYPYELVFPVELPPVGFVNYYVRLVEEGQGQLSAPSPEVIECKPAKAFQEGGEVTLVNQLQEFSFSAEDGTLRSITHKALRSRRFTARQEWLQYSCPYPGSTSCGGAYRFIPDKFQKDIKIPRENATFGLFVRKGPVVQELVQRWRTGLTQLWRLPACRPHEQGGPDLTDPACQAIEVRYRLGTPEWDRDLVTRFVVPAIDNLHRNSSDPNIRERPVLYQDDNGLEIMRRVYTASRFDSPQFNPISGNYYPMVSAAFIRSHANTSFPNGLQFTVVSDRTHSVASLGTGELEIMLHRRSHGVEAGQGLHQLLNDTDSIEPVFRLWLHTADGAELQRGMQTALLNYPPIALYSTCLTSEGQRWNGFEPCSARPQHSWTAFEAPEESDPADTEGLPPQVHLLTLELRKSAVDTSTDPSIETRALVGTHVLLRLAHIYNPVPSLDGDFDDGTHARIRSAKRRQFHLSALPSSSSSKWTSLAFGVSSVFDPLEEQRFLLTSVLLSGYNMSAVVETTLSGNMLKEQCRRTDWASLDPDAVITPPQTSYVTEDGEVGVILRPMEMVTFSLQLKEKAQPVPNSRVDNSASLFVLVVMLIISGSTATLAVYQIFACRRMRARMAAAQAGWSALEQFDDDAPSPADPELGTITAINNSTTHNPADSSAAPWSPTAPRGGTAAAYAVTHEEAYRKHDYSEQAEAAIDFALHASKKEKRRAAEEEEEEEVSLIRTATDAEEP